MKGLLWKLGISMGVVWVTSILISLVAGEAQPMETAPIQTTVKPVQEVTVGLVVGDQTVTLPLEEYITGVLVSEMPAGFHEEAKKAQAVAARTFAMNIMQYGVKHGIGKICPEPGCCQGYLTKEDFLRYGGTEEGYALARKAAEETQGLVITYGENLIDATYFSCSGGRTEAAVAVWGSDIPYLQSVDSPGEEDAAFYTDTVRFSASQLEEALGVTLSGSLSSCFGGVTYTEGGGVQTMRIGGREYSGAQLRSLLGLRSQSFTVTVLSDSVLITTRGWGHRVGMSQYGADAMARTGKDFTQILKHYYQGVEIEAYGQ